MCGIPGRKDLISRFDPKIANDNIDAFRSRARLLQSERSLLRHYANCVPWLYIHLIARTEACSRLLYCTVLTFNRPMHWYSWLQPSCALNASFSSRVVAERYTRCVAIWHGTTANEQFEQYMRCCRASCWSIFVSSSTLWWDKRLTTSYCTVPKSRVACGKQWARAIALAHIIPSLDVPFVRAGDFWEAKVILLYGSVIMHGAGAI